MKYEEMYQWPFVNSTGGPVAAFDTFKVTGLQYRGDEIYLIAAEPTENGAHAQNGPLAVAPGKDGSCALPGAQWAKTQEDYSSGTEVGPVDGTRLLSDQGSGFITVGKRNSKGQTLVTVRGAGGSGTVLIRFELKQDFFLRDKNAVGYLLKQDGTLPAPSSLVEIKLADPHERFMGYGPYENPEDGQEPGFRGVATPNGEDGNGKTIYDIIEIERLYPLILVELNGDVQGDGGTESNFLKGYGNSYRLPSGNAGIMHTYNTDGFADGGRNTSIWVAMYVPEDDQYELIHGETSRESIAMIIGEIGGAAPDGAMKTVEAGKGSSDMEATVLKWDLDGDTMFKDPDVNGGQPMGVRNVTSPSMIEGTIDDPVVMAGYVLYPRNGGAYFVPSYFDLSALPGFDKQLYQIAGHTSGNRDFKLENFCFQLDYVTDVKIVADLSGGGAPDRLVYETPDSDLFSCSPIENTIFEIGPCDP